MTEEIIIDGVNVAECHCKAPYKNDYGDVQCKCYRFEDIENNTFLFGICKQHPNCYYKQLKRLEQKNKKLKEEIQFHDKENSNLLAKRNAAQIGYDEIREVRERYRSALEEIREIVTSAFAKQRPYKEDFAEIETKINEVLQ
jgi:predicted RNase H-like nuclease (RuvC/YqgF family)